jgi:hypothetical protein
MNLESTSPSEDGPKKASEVGFFGQAPRTKAYEAIRELERKGLLQIIPGKPELLYMPSSPTNVLMVVIELKCLEKPFIADFVIVDGKELVVIESKLDDLRTDRGSDLGIWTTNKLLIELQ